MYVRKLVFLHKLLFISENTTDPDILCVAYIRPQSICTSIEEHLSFEMDYSSFIWFETRFPNMNVESGCYLALHHKPTIIHDPCDFIAVLPAIENPTSIRVPQGFCFKINHHFDCLYFSSRQLNRIGLKTNITPLKIDFIYIQCVWKITRFVFLFFTF